jgi:hypothetical protein
MATHAKSKMAANLLRLGFIDFFGSRVQCLHLRRSVFGSRTNVFLSDKAETAVKTRQVFVDALRRSGAFPGASSRKVNERSNHNPCRCDRSWRTMCSRNPKTPATFSNRLTLKPRKGSGINTTQAHLRLAHLKLRAHFLNFLVLLFETRSKSFQSLPLLCVDCWASIRQSINSHSSAIL